MTSQFSLSTTIRRGPVPEHMLAETALKQKELLEQLANVCRVVEAFIAFPYFSSML